MSIKDISTRLGIAATVIGIVVAFTSNFRCSSYAAASTVDSLQHQVSDDHERMARIETLLGEMKSDLGEVKQDIKEIRKAGKP